MKRSPNFKMASKHHSTDSVPFEKLNTILNEKNPPEKDLSSANIWDKLGAKYLNELNFDEAHRCFSKSLEINLLRENDFDIAKTYNNLGFVLEKQGNLLNAFNNYKESVRILELAVTKDYLSIGHAYNNMGSVNETLGNNIDALTCYQKSLNVKRLIFRDDSDVSIGRTTINIGRVHRFLYKDTKNLDNFEKALKCFEYGLDIFLVNAPNNYNLIGEAYNNIGMLYHDQIYLVNKHHDFKNALKYYDEALDAMKMAVPLNYEALGLVYRNMGSVHLIKKEFGTAITFYERSIEMFSNNLLINQSLVQEAKNYINMINNCFRRNIFKNYTIQENIF